MPVLVTRVWIAPGCIVCDACESTCPEVFHVTEDTCVIRPEALSPEFTKGLTQKILEAAEECPVEVIKVEKVEVAEGEAAAEPAAPAPEPTPAPVAAPAPAAPAVASAEKKNGDVVTAASAPAAAPRPAAAVPEETHADVPPTVVDPAIAALLKATTARGGRAGIEKGTAEAPPAVKALRSRPIDELPPDARFERVLEATRQAKAESKVSRRAVIGAAGVGWIALGASAAVSGLALQTFMMPKVLEEPDPRVRLGPINMFAEMPVGGVNEDFKDKGIWIVRLEGEVAALSTTCTHLGCIPNWLATERKFKCPCHGSGFMQNGINFEGPAPRPLERFKVSVEDGVLVVDRSKKFQQEKGEWANPDSFVSV